MRGQYKNKRDANEGPIFDALRQCGFSVYSLDRPCDAIVGFRGHTFLVEVKDGPKARLTPAQSEFLSRWQGHWVRINSVDEALSWARFVRLCDPAIEWRGYIS